MMNLGYVNNLHKKEPCFGTFASKRAHTSSRPLTISVLRIGAYPASCGRALAMELGYDLFKWEGDERICTVI